MFEVKEVSSSIEVHNDLKKNSDFPLITKKKRKVAWDQCPLLLQVELIKGKRKRKIQSNKQSTLRQKL